MLYTSIVYSTLWPVFPISYQRFAAYRTPPRRLKPYDAIGSGRLLSAQSHAQQVAPLTAGFNGFNRNLYYGLGIIVSHSWIVQTPSFAGYAAVMAYLPSKRITLAVTTTRDRHTPAAVNYAQLLARKISSYLAPGSPLILPG